MEQGELAALRVCEREGCGHRVPNGITDLGQILLAMQTHALIGHPAAAGSSEGGGGVPNQMLQFHSWKNRSLKFSGQLGKTVSSAGKLHVKYQTKL